MILEPVITSGEQSASAVIMAMPGLLMSIDLLPPASGNAVLKIYDNAAAASGTIVFECQVASGADSLSVNMSMARYIKNGIYASLTGTTTYIVGYSVA